MLRTVGDRPFTRARSPRCSTAQALRLSHADSFPWQRPGASPLWQRKGACPSVRTTTRRRTHPGENDQCRNDRTAGAAPLSLIEHHPSAGTRLRSVPHGGRTTGGPFRQPVSHPVRSWRRPARKVHATAIHLRGQCVLPEHSDGPFRPGCGPDRRRFLRVKGPGESRWGGW